MNPEQYVGAGIIAIGVFHALAMVRILFVPNTPDWFDYSYMVILGVVFPVISLTLAIALIMGDIQL